jgi:hypothetical protein
MKHQVCLSMQDLAFPIELKQTGIDRFTVTYGKSVKSQLTYYQAAMELGASIMHALSLADRLDNRERRK